jgi:hypothetical protein
MKRLETAFRASLGLDGRLKDYRASIDATRRFTPTGIDAEAAKFVRNEVLPAIVKGHIALAAARRHVKQTWNQLKPKPPDKTDIVSFFKRESIRDELRSLSQEQRDTYLTRFAAELDPDVLLAAVETVNFPWQEAGQHFISDATRTALTKRLVAADHAEQIEAVEQIEQAIEYAAPTIEQGRVEIQTTLAMNEIGWQQSVAAEARKGPPVWLKRHGDKIVTLFHDGIDDMTKKPNLRARTPTQEEIECGVYYNDETEWQAAVTAAA